MDVTTCFYCLKRLKAHRGRQCTICGMDWRVPQDVRRRRTRNDSAPPSPSALEVLPPPVEIDGDRVMAWAVVRDGAGSVSNACRDAIPGASETATRLVLTRSYIFDAPCVDLLSCDDQWTVLACETHDDLWQAQALAEQTFQGIDSCWVYLPPPGEEDDSRRQTHRTIFRFDTAFLDAVNFDAAEKAWERFRSAVPDGLRIAIDFGQVQYISEVWPVLPIMQAGSRVQGHVVVCMRFCANLQGVFELLGLSNTPGYKYIGDGVCPACGGPFDNVAATCSNCGRFEVETFTWRPGG